MVFAGRLQFGPIILLIPLLLVTLSFSGIIRFPEKGIFEYITEEGEVQFSNSSTNEVNIGDNPWVEVHVSVSEAEGVTVYERTGGYNIYSYDLVTLMGPGGFFSTVAGEQYTVLSDGNSLTIHCYRPNIDGGGNNVVATRLDGVVGSPGGLWATHIESFAVGTGGTPESRFNALGEHMLNHTRLGDEHSEIVLGYSYIYEVLPPANLTTSVQNTDIVLNWTPSPSFGIDLHRVYAGNTPRSIDLTNPIGSTQLGSSSPVWIHSGGASNREYYYVVRAYNTTYGLESYTSNTAGVFAVQFEKGRNAFSLPLQPFNLTYLSDLWVQMPGALTMYWMGPSDRWVTYEGPGYPDVFAQVGKGYMIDLPQEIRHVFTGLPGSMIGYKDGFGFDSMSRGSLDGVFGNKRVLLQWSEPCQNVSYFRVLRSKSRDGFFEVGGYQEIGTMPGGSNPIYFVDFDPFSDSNMSHYLIVPVDPLGRNGSTSFSLAVVRMEFSPGTTSFGIPVKAFEIHSVETLSSTNDPVVGVSYFTNGIWKFHAKEMPTGVYDSTVTQGEGYQISVDLDGPVRIEFIGM